MTSHCGGDNDVNDYERGWAEGRSAAHSELSEARTKYVGWIDEQFGTNGLSHADKQKRIKEVLDAGFAVSAQLEQVRAKLMEMRATLAPTDRALCKKLMILIQEALAV
jgi:Xaa-Pro aminopeptidase